MNLEDFIHTALLDIALGVQRAAVDAREIVAINPGVVNGEPVSIERDVEFDIAVTVSQTAESRKSGGGDVGAALKVVAFEAHVGAKGQLDSKSVDKTDQVSRVKFSIPVRFNMHFRADPNGPAIAKETQAAIDRLKHTRS